MSEHTISIAEGGGPGFMVCELPVCVGPEIWNGCCTAAAQRIQYVERAVVIRCVKKGSQASAAGLTSGDILLRSLSGSSSGSVDAMRYNDFIGLVKTKKSGPLVLRVLRIQIESKDAHNGREKNDNLPGIRPLLMRCRRTCGWSNAFAKRVFRSYIQFLEIKAIASDRDGKILFPPIPVEEMWRQHCSDVWSYYQICSNICRRGGSVDYNPDAWLKMDHETMRRQQNQTLDVLYEYFEDEAIDKEIWSCGVEGNVHSSRKKLAIPNFTTSHVGCNDVLKDRPSRNRMVPVEFDLSALGINKIFACDIHTNDDSVKLVLRRIVDYCEQSIKKPQLPPVSIMHDGKVATNMDGPLFSQFKLDCIEVDSMPRFSIVPTPEEEEYGIVDTFPNDSSEGATIAKASNSARKKQSSVRGLRTCGDGSQNQSKNRKKRKKEEKEVCRKQVLSVAQVVERLNSNEDQNDNSRRNNDRTTGGREINNMSLY